MLIHVNLLSQNAVLPEPTEHINVFRLKVAACVESQPMVTLDAGLSFVFPPNAHATVHTTADIWKYGPTCAACVSHVCRYTGPLVA